MRNNVLLRPASILAVVFAGSLLIGCVSQETKMGEGATEVTGSGGAAGAEGESDRLFKCARPIGTAALLEPENISYTEYGLSSPVPLVKLIMAQSKCFKVVSRGAAGRALERERALAAGGQLERGSRMGGGQMVAADYLIEPAIVHKDSDAGGGFSGLGGFLPGYTGLLAGGVKTTDLEAQTLLTVTDVRTGVQEAIAEGSATKKDVGWGGLGFAGAVGGLGGAYADTDVGKIVAAAFLDAHNNLVTQLGAIPADAGRDADHAGYKTTSGVNFRSGPSTNSPVIKTLAKGTSVIPTGAKQGAWWEVEVGGRTGWLHSNYIGR